MLKDLLVATSWLALSATLSCRLDERSLTTASAGGGGAGADGTGGGGRADASASGSTGRGGAPTNDDAADRKTDGSLAPVTRLTVMPTAYEFASTQRGTPSDTQAFRIDNVGTSATGVLGPAVLGGIAASDFAVAVDGCRGGVVAPGNGCSVTVRFVPQSEGLKTATLTVESSLGEGATAQLSGVALANASLTLDPPAGDFHTVVVNTTASITFRLQNGGGVTTATPAVQLTGIDATQFAIADNLCLSPLAAGSVCTLTAQFKPTAVGPKAATLTVAAGAGISASCPLTGTAATQGSLAIDLPSKDFGALALGITSAPAHFSVTNQGTSPTGTLSTRLLGSIEFGIAADGCDGMALAARGGCTIEVTLTPSSAGSKNGTLQISANPGGTTSASLSGQGLAPPMLTIGAPTPFPQTMVGSTSVSQTLRVTNTGDSAAGTTTPPAVAITGTDAASFVMGANGCTAALPAHSSCDVGLAFAPTSAGSKTATLSVSSAPGGSAMVSLSGSSQGRPGALSASATSNSFGTVEVGTTTSPFTWTITNMGDVASGVPMLTNDNPAEFSVVNNCTAAVAGGRPCTVVVRHTPSAGGSRTGNLTLSASPGGAVSLMLSSLGVYRVTVAVNGTGTVTSNPAGINCPSTCSGLFASGALLHAQPTNGSGFFFTGWSGGGCSGLLRDCTPTVNGPTTVTATFSRMNANLIFISSEMFPTNLGSAAAYDARCNAAATTAGINNAAGNGYISFTSDASSTPTMRLGANARGWLRMDGKPFADSQASLFTNNQVFNAIVFKETGNAEQAFVGTGTASDGSLATTCTNWTGTGAIATSFSIAGPQQWTRAFDYDCAGFSTISVICMGRTANSAVSPIVTAGRKIWISAPYTLGTSITPDAHCLASLPTGVMGAAALIPRSGRPASFVLDGAMNYVRPDGTLVGTGADIAASRLASGIWQLANQTYQGSFVLTGVTTPAMQETPACGEWTSTLGNTPYGMAWFMNSWWWGYDSMWMCASPAAGVYCVQTVP